MVFFLYREVFKARERASKSKVVAMKRVLLDNEKEGVCMLVFTYHISISHSALVTQHLDTSKASFV